MCSGGEPRKNNIRIQMKTYNKGHKGQRRSNKLRTFVLEASAPIARLKILERHMGVSLPEWGRLRLRF